MLIRWVVRQDVQVVHRARKLDTGQVWVLFSRRHQTVNTHTMPDRDETITIKNNHLIGVVLVHNEHRQVCTCLVDDLKRLICWETAERHETRRSFNFNTRGEATATAASTPTTARNGVSVGIRV